MAEVIRESVDRYVQDELDTDLAERRARALKVAGGFASGLGDLSRRHDEYFAGTGK